MFLSLGVAAGAGGLAWLTWRALGRWLPPANAMRTSRRRGVLWRAPNYADQPVLTPSGLVVVAIGALGVVAIVDLAAAGLLVGFGALGYVDDRASAVDEPRGLRGHLRALLAHGKVTAGLVKALGGLAVALVVIAVAPSTPDAGAPAGSVGANDGLDDLIVGTLVVALFANFVNLCDRAPGRATKVSAGSWLALLIGAAIAGTSANAALVAAPTVGAALGLLDTELDEAQMLGDTGSNALGAVLGFGVVLAAAPPVERGVLAALVALTLLSELVSFSRVIEAVALLRWLDRLGGKRHR